MNRTMLGRNQTSSQHIQPIPAVKHGSGGVMIGLAVPETTIKTSVDSRLCSVLLPDFSQALSDKDLRNGSKSVTE